MYYNEITSKLNLLAITRGQGGMLQHQARDDCAIAFLRNRRPSQMWNDRFSAPRKLLPYLGDFLILMVTLHVRLDNSDLIPREVTCHRASSYTVKRLVTPIKLDTRFATTYTLVAAAPGHLASNVGMGLCGDGWPTDCGSLPARRFPCYVFRVTWLDISTSTANDIRHRSSPYRSDT